VNQGPSMIGCFALAMLLLQQIGWQSALHAAAPGGPFPVNANGEPIGALLGIDHFISHTSWVSVLSDRGYPFEVSSNGTLRFFSLFYDQPNCEGPPLFISLGSDFLTSMGFVFQVPSRAGLGFAASIPKGSTRSPIKTTASVLKFGFDGGNCVNEKATGLFIVVMPNDVNMTGVPNSNFVAPITIGTQEDPRAPARR